MFGLKLDLGLGTAYGVAIITRGLYFEPNYINSDYIQGE